MASVFEDFDQTPALESAERAGFHDTHTIADLSFVLLVVSVKFCNMLGDLAEFGMRHTSHRTNDDGFIHLVGDDFTDAGLAEGALADRGGSWDSGGFFAHLLCRWRRRFQAEHGFDTGDVAAQGMEHVRLFKLSALLLDAEVKNFLPELAFAGQKFLGCEFFDFGDLHGINYPA